MQAYFGMRSPNLLRMVEPLAVRLMLAPDFRLQRYLYDQINLTKGHVHELLEQLRFCNEDGGVAG